MFIMFVGASQYCGGNGNNDTKDVDSDSEGPEPDMVQTASEACRASTGLHVAFLRFACKTCFLPAVVFLLLPHVAKRRRTEERSRM